MIDYGSFATANNKGLKGHLWWDPLPSLKYWDLIPLMLTEALGEKYKSVNLDINLEPMQNLV